MLVQYGSNPDLEFGFDGQTCLMSALNAGQLEVAKVLVEAGANIQAKDTLGRSVLSYALEAIHAKGIALLLHHNVKFHGIDHKLKWNGTSQLNSESDLLIYSCCNIRSEPIATMLFLAGANPEALRQNLIVFDTNGQMLDGLNSDIKTFIKEVVENTVPLKQLCRTVVRHHLFVNIQNEVELLPTATVLKQYILMPELKPFLVAK